jgi:hypothetical protein
MPVPGKALGTKAAEFRQGASGRVLDLTGVSVTGAASARRAPSTRKGVTKSNTGTVNMIVLDSDTTQAGFRVAALRTLRFKFSCSSSADALAARSSLRLGCGAS